jgi:hypothetical protein
VVGAPAWLGDADSVGDPLAGVGLADCDDVGLCEPDGEGDPDDGDGEAEDGDADCGDGEADCGDGDPEGGGDPDCDDGGGVVGSGFGAWLGGDWLNIRIASRIASIAMRIMISQDARIETRPARS